MNILIVVISKISMIILKKMGRGTSFPGKLALTLNKNIIKDFKLPSKTIFVTGTNGKSSISGMLKGFYEAAGFTVGNNSKGSNLINGIITEFIEHSDLKGTINKDVLIIEIDERYIKEVFKDIKPHYLIVSNLARDQQARNGNFTIVFDDIKRVLTDDIHLFLNADDPIVTNLADGHNGKLTFYSLERTIYSTKSPTYNNLDMLYCPRCNNKLNIEFFQYSNICSFKCNNCGFGNNIPDYQGRLTKELDLEINGNLINLENHALYTAYNYLACYAVLKETGISEELCMYAFKNTNYKIKRLAKFNYSKKNETLLVCKVETPLTWNTSIEYISRNNTNEAAVIIGFDKTSSRYKLKDISWVWDVNMSLLNDNKIKKIICIGEYAYDIKAKLKHDSVNLDKVEIELNSQRMLKIIEDMEYNNIFLVYALDMEKTFKKLLNGVNYEN